MRDDEEHQRQHSWERGRREAVPTKPNTNDREDTAEAERGDKRTIEADEEDTIICI